VLLDGGINVCRNQHSNTLRGSNPVLSPADPEFRTAALRHFLYVTASLISFSYVQDLINQAADFGSTLIRFSSPSV